MRVRARCGQQANAAKLSSTATWPLIHNATAASSLATMRALARSPLDVPSALATTPRTPMDATPQAAQGEKAADTPPPNAATASKATQQPQGAARLESPRSSSPENNGSSGRKNAKSNEWPMLDPPQHSDRPWPPNPSTHPSQNRCSAPNLARQSSPHLIDGEDHSSKLRARIHADPNRSPNRSRTRRRRVMPSRALHQGPPTSPTSQLPHILPHRPSTWLAGGPGSEPPGPPYCGTQIRPPHP